MKKTALALGLVTLLSPIAAFAGDAANGEKIFTEKKCAMCHGAKFEKKPVDVSDEAKVVKFLTSDAKHKTKVADEAAAKDLAAYLKTIKK